MALPPLPALSPFDVEPQSVEAALDEQFSFKAQLDFQKRQHQQLAQRQSDTDSNMRMLYAAVGRVMDTQSSDSLKLEIIYKGVEAIAKKMQVKIPPLPASKTS